MTLSLCHAVVLPLIHLNSFKPVATETSISLCFFSQLKFVCPLFYCSEIDAARHAPLSVAVGVANAVGCRLEEPMSTGAVSHQLCGGSEAAVERLLQFGRQLHQLSEQLQAERGAHSDEHRKALRVRSKHYTHDIYSVHRIAKFKNVLHRRWVIQISQQNSVVVFIHKRHL